MENETTYTGLLTPKQSRIWGAINMLSVGMWKQKSGISILKQTISFSKIEFKKGDTVLASFCDDDGWSYIGVENSKAKMFKSFRIDSAHTAVVFRGGAYATGVPFLSVFVLSGNEVKLIFNKEYFIEKI